MTRMLRNRFCRALVACALFSGLPAVWEGSSALAAPRVRRPGPSSRPALVKRLAYDRQRHAVVLGVSGQITVSTRTVPNPLRLVVDLPGARLVTPNRLLVVEDGLVSRVRVAQFAVWPPVVRVVLEPVAGEEPRLAVQQDGRRLFITVAPPPSSGLSEVLPASPALSPGRAPEPKAPTWPNPPLPGAPAAGASALPALTRPGIRQRLRPPEMPTPQRSGDVETWPTLLPQGVPPRPPAPAPPANATAPPTPASPLVPPAPASPLVPPAPASPLVPPTSVPSRAEPPTVRPVLPPGGDESLETYPFPPSVAPRSEGPPPAPSSPEER
ncbi:MAG: AMIN domain-containing protein [Candidatus Sericytochromatia bacterium]|nr:AMIN domain-containing protein [Candidatus Sericytochromatia bacterium]